MLEAIGFVSIIGTVLTSPLTATPKPANDVKPPPVIVTVPACEPALALDFKRTYMVWFTEPDEGVTFTEVA